MRITALFIVLFCTAHVASAQTENFWTKKSDFGGMKRERAVAVSINNFGYVGTGVDTNETVHNDWWQYDAVLDTWTQKATIPGSVRRNAVAFTSNGRAYIGTGIDSAEASVPNSSVLKDLWEYNPLTNSWAAKADYPGGGGGGVYFATAFTLDNKGFVACGKIGADSYIKEVWEYKPTTDTWLQCTDFPGGHRYQLCSFVVDDKAYVGLGADYNTYLDDIWQYNAGNGIWIRMNDFAGGHRGAVSTFTLGQRGFVCLGTDGGLKTDLWEYNPFLDTWTARASYDGSARRCAIAFTVYGKAYVGTGDGYSGKKASMYEYTPPLVLSTDESAAISFHVYPVPSCGNITISSQENISHYEILDLSGKKVQEIPAYGILPVNSDCSLLERGTYLLRAVMENGQVSQCHPLILQ